MCGRFARYVPKRQIAEEFDLDDALDGLFDLVPRYNIAPAQQVAVVGQTSEGKRKLTMMRWGLVPAWAPDPSAVTKTFNARAATLTQKPTFRDPFLRRRCLVVASGFYEWDRRKQPVYFYHGEGKPLAFAGIWDTWKGGDGKRINSCSIITIEANDLVKQAHDRMPAIIGPEHYSDWLDRNETDARRLGLLLAPYQALMMASHPVSKRVNNVRCDDELCSSPANF